MSALTVQAPSSSSQDPKGKGSEDDESAEKILVFVINHFKGSKILVTREKLMHQVELGRELLGIPYFQPSESFFKDIEETFSLTRSKQPQPMDPLTTQQELQGESSSQSRLQSRKNLPDVAPLKDEEATTSVLKNKESGRKRKGKTMKTPKEDSESTEISCSSFMPATQSDVAQNLNTNQSSPPPPKKSRVLRKPKRRTLGIIKDFKENEKVHLSNVDGLYEADSCTVAVPLPGPVSKQKLPPNSPLIDDQPWITTTRKRTVAAAQGSIQKKGTSKRKTKIMITATIQEDSPMDETPNISVQSQASKKQKAGGVSANTSAPKVAPAQSIAKASKVDEEGLLIAQEKTYNVRSTRSKSKLVPGSQAVFEPTHVTSVKIPSRGRKKKNDVGTLVVNSVEVIDLGNSQGEDSAVSDKSVTQETKQDATTENQTAVNRVEIDGEVDKSTKSGVVTFDGNAVTSSDAESPGVKRGVSEEVRLSSSSQILNNAVTLPETEDMTQFDEVAAEQGVEVLEKINGDDWNGFVEPDCKKPSDDAEVNSVIISDNEGDETSSSDQTGSDVTVISVNSHNRTRESMNLGDEPENGSNTDEVNDDIYVDVVPDSPYVEEEQDSANFMNVDHEEEIKDENVDKNVVLDSTIERDDEQHEEENNENVLESQEDKRKSIEDQYKEKEENEKGELNSGGSKFLNISVPESFDFSQMAKQSGDGNSFDLCSQDMFASQTQQQFSPPNFEFGIVNEVRNNPPPLSKPNQNYLAHASGHAVDFFNGPTTTSSCQPDNNERSQNDDEVIGPSSSLAKDGKARAIPKKGILKRKAQFDDEVNSLNLSDNRLSAKEPPKKKLKVTINDFPQYAPLSPTESLGNWGREREDEEDRVSNKSNSIKRSAGAKRRHAHHRKMLPKSSIKYKTEDANLNPNPGSIFLRPASGVHRETKAESSSVLPKPVTRTCPSSLPKDHIIRNTDLTSDTTKEDAQAEAKEASSSNTENTLHNESELSEIDLSNLEDPADYYKNSQSFLNPSESVAVGFPLLKDCKHSVHLVTKDLIPHASKHLLVGALNAMHVKTIGDLCSLRVFEVLKLPIDPTPRLTTFRSVMTKYAETIGLVNSLPQTPNGLVVNIRAPVNEQEIIAAKDPEYPDSPNLIDRNNTTFEVPVVEVELIVSPEIPEILANRHSPSREVAAISQHSKDGVVVNEGSELDKSIHSGSKDTNTHKIIQNEVENVTFSQSQYDERCSQQSNSAIQSEAFFSSSENCDIREPTPLKAPLPSCSSAPLSNSDGALASNADQSHNVDDDDGGNGGVNGTNTSCTGNTFPECLNESVFSPSNNNQMSQFKRGNVGETIGRGHLNDLSEVEVANRSDTEAESGTYSYSRLSGENMTETSSSSTSMDRKTFASHNLPDFMNLRVVTKLKQFLKSDCEEAGMLCKLLLSDRDIRKKLMEVQNEFEDKKDLSILKIRLPTALVPSVFNSSKDDGKASEVIVNHVQEILNGLEHKCESKLLEGVDQFKDWSNELLKLLQKDGDCEELSVQEILQVIKTQFAKLRMLEMRLGDQWKGVTAKSFLENMEENQSPTELLQMLAKLANLVMGMVE